MILIFSKENIKQNYCVVQCFKRSNIITDTRTSVLHRFCALLFVIGQVIISITLFLALVDVVDVEIKFHSEMKTISCM